MCTIVQACSYMVSCAMLRSYSSFSSIFCFSFRGKMSYGKSQSPRVFIYSATMAYHTEKTMWLPIMGRICHALFQVCLWMSSSRVHHENEIFTPIPRHSCLLQFQEHVSHSQLSAPARKAA